MMMCCNDKVNVVLKPRSDGDELELSGEFDEDNNARSSWDA